MSNSDVVTRLRAMHAELVALQDDLKSGEDADEEALRALDQLAADLKQLSQRAHELGDFKSTAEEHPDIVDRIKKFESNHPTVTRFLSQMTDFLAMIGI